MRAFAAALVGLVVVACGGGGGPAGTPTHDSPEGAVRGLVDAMAANDLKGAADWVAPDERSDFTSAIDESKQLGLTISFHVKDFSITSVSSSGDQATVKYSGDASACIAGPNGATGTDGSGCHPLQSQSGSQRADTLACVRRNGSWYVSLKNSLGG